MACHGCELCEPTDDETLFYDRMRVHQWWVIFPFQWWVIGMHMAIERLKEER